MKAGGCHGLKRNSQIIIYYEQKNKEKFNHKQRENLLSLIISLEVPVGNRNQDKKTSLIKDMESHFLLKHQMAKSVIMGFPIYLDFSAPQVAQEERKKLSTNALG